MLEARVTTSGSLSKLPPGFPLAKIRLTFSPLEASHTLSEARPPQPVTLHVCSMSRIRTRLRRTFLWALVISHYERVGGTNRLTMYPNQDRGSSGWVFEKRKTERRRWRKKCPACDQTNKDNAAYLADHSFCKPELPSNRNYLCNITGILLFYPRSLPHPQPIWSWLNGEDGS